MTARTTVQMRTREALPPSLGRDLESIASPRPRSSGERPTSIKDAIIRWLNEEL